MSEPAPPALLKGYDVLVVEDHVDTATVITLLLKKYGHRVTTAGTIAEGLDRFSAGGFDAVVSDLGLPDGTGCDFITRVRQTSKVPAVALTGYGQDDDISKCRDAGFDAHLTKPVNFAELDATIRRLVAAATA